MKLAINNLHPFSKLGYIGLIIVLSTWFQAWFTYVFSFFLLSIWFIFVPEKKEFIKRMVITNLFLFLPMFIMQLFFKPGENLLFSWFILKITEESLYFSVNLFVRLWIVSTSILLFFHTTKAKDLMIALEKIGAPKSITYMFLSTIMLVPQTIRQSKAIMEAQQVRGIRVQGNIFIRFKAFLPMIMPLILTSLLSIEERALTLEARGFFSSNEKTYINTQNMSKIDTFILIFCIIILIFFIIGKVII